MPNYELLYHTLFNAITDAIKHLDNAELDAARTLLIRAQQLSEELSVEMSAK